MFDQPAHRPPGLHIWSAPTAEAASRKAADLVLERLRNRPNLLLCAAAGGSPTLLYHLLGETAASEPGLFAQVRVIQVDEWHGLPPQDPASCQSDLRRKLISPLRLDEARFIHFNSDARDPEGECRRIAQWLAANGPIDIAVLGVGSNGHLAMNEPAPALQPHAHVAALSAVSQAHPLLASRPRKPSRGLTLGMADLLWSREILLLAFGAAKRGVLERLVRPEMTTMFPASLLWLHRAVTVVCDAAAQPKPEG